MRKNLDEIKTYVKKLEGSVDKELKDLVDLFMGAKKINKQDEARFDDSGVEDICIKKEIGVPVYLIKSRVKKPESIYLKTKRKNLELSDFQDIGGLRLLCLFQIDIFDVCSYFSRVISSEKYAVLECKVFNWPKDSSFEKLKSIIKEYFADIKVELINKMSGYKSIHFVIKKDSDEAFPIEVQIRTLLQDVWGSLEHALSYKKGSVHPHIKKSFYLLSKDLQNIDDLLTHLRDISDKEHCGEQYMNYKVGPKHLFTYEKKMLPKCFRKRGKLYSEYKVYWGLLEKYEKEGKNYKVLVELKNSLSLIHKGLSADEKETDKCINYWYNMERAYLFFCEARYGEAIEIYRSIIKKHQSRYCAYYRLGEVLFLLGDIEQALNAFDGAEKALLDSPQNDYINHYRIKSRLALAYWYLGEEYADISVKEIDDAYKIYEDYKEDQDFKDVFKLRDYEQLVNNVCWYYLERFIVAKNSAINKERQAYARQCFGALKEKYLLVENILGEGCSSNTLDTAAWYCYNYYKETRSIRHLIKARDYCLQMKNHTSDTSYSFSSLNIQKNHIQEIMNSGKDIKLKVTKKKRL